ncbi:MAG: hypothetical protein RR847_00835 [Bacilli bacterium]
MSLTIGYLYYDLLNLYGENGNIKFLKKQLETLNINTKVYFLTIGDKIDFSKFDLIYIGAGTEDNQMIALKDLLKYKNDIKKYIEDKKFFLATGNSIDLFGKYIINKNSKKTKGLGTFTYSVKQESFRIIDEAFFTSDFLDKPFIGFQNQNSIMQGNKHTMFKVIKGIGSYPNSLQEGIHYNNFYGTYLIGPLLIRNPHFLEYLIKKLILAKDPNYTFKNFDLFYEQDAYETFINNFYPSLLKKPN